jgi:hypothetical protein
MFKRKSTLPLQSTVSEIIARLSREAKRDRESVVSMEQTNVDIQGLVSLRVLYRVLMGKNWSDLLDVVSTFFFHSASMTKTQIKKLVQTLERSGWLL